MSRHIPCAGNGLVWVDVVGPKREELGELARQYDLHRTSVDDCLEPEHLPKYERIGETNFVIFRAIDELAPPDAVTVQEFTRKVAIFVRPDLFLTVRRTDQPFFQALVAGREGDGAGRRQHDDTASSLLADLTNAVLNTYGPPLEAVEDAIARAEETLFARQGPAPIEEIYLLKRRVSLVRRLLWKTQGAIHQFVAPAERSSPLFTDLRENADSWHFYADELLDDLSNLLSVHLSLASHRTNEVMRILTVFSAFFLPLTFIVGIYGMNFAFMPELNVRWGYPVALLAMGAISLVIGIWFRRRGWLGRPR